MYDCLKEASNEAPEGQNSLKGDGKNSDVFADGLMAKVKENGNVLIGQSEASGRYVCILAKKGMA